MPLLSLNKVSVRYDSLSAPAVSSATLSIASGDFVVLTGRSGCGKTSLLNVAAGFVEPAGGTATVDGRSITAPGADRAVVFQNDALFPWLSVRDNISFSLRMRGVAERERRERTDALLHQVKLDSYGDKAIWELSGGMRQRAAICRALLCDPKLLLMDEPFGALDALTREDLQLDLLDIHARTRKTILLVTHSISEAVLLSDRVAVMSARPGRLQDLIDIEIPRPRSHETPSLPQFLDYSRRIRDDIFGPRLATGSAR